MSIFSPLPLGQRIPGSPHAVSCSLPTMHDLRGYEEKDPEITRQMTSGYPRFVVHPFLQRLAHHLTQRHALGGYALWLVSSRRMGDRLAAHLGAPHVVRIEDGPVYGVAHPASTELANRAKTFLQNTGGFLSSRAAEDRLAHHHLLQVTPEKLCAGDALAEVRRELAPLFPGVAPADLAISNCGMNAVDAAFRAVSELQALRGRTQWVQLGWLYRDTIALLQNHTANPADYLCVPDVFDLAAIERLFGERGRRIAGLVTELPTNPLVQTPDIAAISALARRHGAAVILDPSISSPYDVDVLAHADVVVASLTKYTASDGDLLAGLVAVNPASPDAAQLRRGVATKLEPIYPRDLARLAHEIKETPEVLAKVHANVLRIVEFLSGHPAVKDVYWALHPASRDHYLKLARSPQSVGSMITFTLRGALDPVYDRVALPKGPSFGMKTTLLCPFMYLAHYDLASTAEGRARMQAQGVDPNLLRLSVGIEPAADIIDELRAGLDAGR
jgi:cystathionine gamma-synthase